MLKTTKAYTHFKGLFTAVLSLQSRHVDLPFSPSQSHASAGLAVFLPSLCFLRYKHLHLISPVQKLRQEVQSEEELLAQVSDPPRYPNTSFTIICTMHAYISDSMQHGFVTWSLYKEFHSLGVYNTNVETVKRDTFIYLGGIESGI